MQALHQIPTNRRQVFAHKLGRSFAAIGTDGRVTTWGHGSNGGDSLSVKEKLQDVQDIKVPPTRRHDVLLHMSLI